LSGKLARTLLLLLLPTVVIALVGCALLAFSRRPNDTVSNRELTATVARLTAEVNRLSQQQAMPGALLAQHRSSICFIYALYSLTPLDGGWRMRPIHTRVSGTGFVVAPGIIATNRHVAQPWFDDDQDSILIRRGAVPHLERLVAFFPDLATPVELSGVHVSATEDLAIARYSLTAAASALRPLPLADSPGATGEPVVVVGYPMGVTVMLAKSPRKVYRRLSYSHETMDIARDLAAHLLIRPSATYGHLGDIVEDRLIYDAPTAQGGSGGPVFNSRGEVIGVNAAYIDGFAGGTLGVSVQALKALLRDAQSPHSGSAGSHPALQASDGAPLPDYRDLAIPAGNGSDQQH